MSTNIESPPITHCKHCRVLLEKHLQDKRIVFCCNGCASVYKILHEYGLQTYYSLKEKASEPALKQGAVVRWEYLDDPEFTQWETNQTGEKTLSFHIEGIHCTACLWLLEQLPAIDLGIKSIHLNLGSHIAKVTLFKEGSFQKVAELIQNLGYFPQPIKTDADAQLYQSKEQQKQLLRMGVAAFSSGNLMILSVALYAGLQGSIATFFVWLSFILALPTLTYSAWPFYYSAWTKLKHGHISIDTPIAFSLGAGIISSFYALYQGSEGIYFDTLSTLVFLLLLSRYFLQRIQANILNKGAFLNFYQAEYIDVYRSDKAFFESIYPDKVKAGDLIRILPGDRLPVDGVLEVGESTMDESILTGESVPVIGKPGQELWAGSQNLGKPIHIRVTHGVRESRLSKILEKAQGHHLEKSEFIQFTDTVSRYFMVAILVLASAVWLYWLPIDLKTGGERALALIIISCPCALALSLPLIFSMGSHRASKSGFLVRSGSVFERLWSVKNILFDKTGTLTRGEFELLSHTPLSTELKAAIVGLESHSKHPIAKALQKTFHNIKPKVFTEVEALKSGGLKGLSKGKVWEIKPVSHLSENTDTKSALTEIEVYTSAQKVAALSLGDTLRSESKTLIQSLKKEGYSCALVSGDQPAPCTYVAQAIGIEESAVFSQQAPTDKEATAQRFEASLMIGDGANDAIALAAAYVGVSLKSAITDHIASADVHILTGGAAQLPLLLSQAKHIKKLVIISLSISIAYNILGVSAAALGWVTPLFAAILMPFSSLTVTGIALWGGQKS